ncbi:hypothetical protein [Pontibacter vulgaris]|uniref:hypothetical protein n=1 Tax=Pontibacter vulgaris TaxID=2905679 RepID=UPI001FA7CA05|nr:hypothetical protein [Pontibacter vulgaris]
MPENKGKKHFLNLFGTNRLDKQGRNHGRWKIYIGDVMVRNGRFRHGREVGKWRYYHMNGNLFMEEKYKRKLNYIPVTRYHENGNLARTGQARRIESGNIIKYFWFGEWQVYNSAGEYSHTELYENGNLVIGKL